MLVSRPFFIALGALLWVGACETPVVEAPASSFAQGTPAPAALEASAEPTAPDGPLYSPFVVDVTHGHLPFRQITFKDVGMSLAPEDRAHVYELVAEELRAGLHDAGISASVSHDPRWSEPAYHRACQGGHIYVDMWQGGTPESGTGNWGYSLWSGCEEASEFGRGDVPGRADGVAAAQPLARHIVQRIQSAADSRCFRKHC